MNQAYRLPFPADRLFGHATRILDDAGSRYGSPFPWTFGGGTVLALRHRHRYSKDIDIFLPDPQYLGYLTPRLSDAAASGDPEYEEAAEFVKIYYPEGEVDFVAGSPLTAPGWQAGTVQDRAVRLETDVEIVAKKLHYRGDRFKARDVFDLAMLLGADPAVDQALRPWAQRHHGALCDLLLRRPEVLRATFEVIDAQAFRPTFEGAVSAVLRFLGVTGQR
ncbi:MAG: nucleotidyl transferase AbiEii/AbiGii toxin family protein [Burkholderiaceae bacterium]